MLLGNGIRHGCQPMRRLGAVIATSAEPQANRGGGIVRNWWAGDGTVLGGVSLANKSAFPDGYVHSACWILAPKAGGMSARGRVIGTGTLVPPNLAGGLNGTAPLTGTGTISDADLALIVSAAAGLTGSGTISNADIVGKLEAAAALVGDGDLAAALGALAGLSSGLTGAGSLVGSSGAEGSMSADIVVTGASLSTANVGDAVWTTLLEAGFDASRILRVIAAATAGESTGGPGSPVFRNLGDTQSQVSGTANSSGDRSGVTYGA